MAGRRDPDPWPTPGFLRFAIAKATELYEAALLDYRANPTPQAAAACKAAAKTLNDARARRRDEMSGDAMRERLDLAAARRQSHTE